MSKYGLPMILELLQAQMRAEMVRDATPYIRLIRENQFKPTTSKGEGETNALHNGRNRTDKT